MEIKRLKRAFYTFLIVTAIVLGITALVMLSQTAQNSEQFGRLQGEILLINAVGALVLLALIAGNLYRLLRDYRRGRPGARLKARMLTAFVGLALAPVVIVYFFAVQFLNRGIETWFDVEIESGLVAALRLSRSALDERMGENMASTREMAGALAGLSDQELVPAVQALRQSTGALELTVFGANSRIKATSSAEPSGRMPVLLSEEVAMQLSQNGAYVGLDPTADGGYRVRTAIVFPPEGPGGESFSLQALFPVGERLATLADSVQDSYTRYEELLFLREPLKYSFTLTLSLVVLLSFLTAVYGAFIFARRLVAPIQHLVAGTRAVAKGDFDTRIPMASRDEIGFLIDSFNDMIQRLAQAREETRISEQQVEKERANLAAILARLSTGVIALEAGQTIRIANQAAGAILNADLTGSAGRRLGDLAADHPLLDQFLEAYEAHLATEETEWREQVVLRGEKGRRVLMCACTALPGEGDTAGGSVMVFDDITALLQAQRDAAWGEVARRLAHEIKNPLTPIQLSAERIRRRYLGTMKDMEAQVLERATHTIVQQVEAMRDMVNSFSEYARVPEIRIARFPLNQHIREVAYLYRAQEHQPVLELHLDEQVTEIEADAVRVRQLLHNLIRNAFEALEGREDGVVQLATRLCTENGREFAEIKVSDNGHGIDADTLEQIFEPYVTTKSKGTGLGLAIVKKLVEEHGGSIKAENLPGGGACISIRLPVKQAARGDATDHRSRRPEFRRERA